MLTSSERIWDCITQGVFVIAEAGKGFIQTQEEQTVAQYLANAKALVDAAVVSGVSAIKWQTHTVWDEQLHIEVTSPHFKGSDRYNWVKRNTNATPLEEFWKPLQSYCKEKGILFFSTPMSRGAAILLHEALDVPLWKIGSADILDFVMLDYIRNTDKPIIISSGMSTLEEVQKAVSFLQEKNNKVCLLHCVSQYPCPPEDLRLGTIRLYQELFPNVPIGFSDHSIGIDDALCAVALGATVIEKHFSLSRDLWGSDHKVSMLPEEARALMTAVQDIQHDDAKKQTLLSAPRAIEALTYTEKMLQDSEAVFRPLFRKSLVFAGNYSAGTIVTKDMLYAMRPQQYAGGMPSELYEQVLGSTLQKDVKEYESFNEDILKK